jgi:hypothetical protein
MLSIWLVRDHVKDDYMTRMLTQRLSSQQARNHLSRGLALFVAIIIIILVVVLVVLSIQLVSIWVTDWQGGHGHYPTGHLTYTVPTQWDTVTLTDVQYPAPQVWWSVFPDRVTLTSPTYADCFTDQQCATQPPTGARVDLESGADNGRPTIEAWYQHWATVTDSKLGPTTVLPLSDYTAVLLGRQHAICAASQDGSQLLPPHVPPSPHFDATFAGYMGSPYVGQAVVMCFALWHGRAYYVEVAVQLHHTATKARDLRDAAQLIESLRFT